MSLLSGFIGETTAGQGQYVANLFDFDLNGNNIGFWFTASGCVPVNYTVITQQNVSGRLFAGSGLTFPASGANVVVPIASQSGTTVIVPVASQSGTNVIVPITSVSGINVVVPIGSISGVNAVASVSSGSLFLASGSVFINTFASGVVGGGSGNFPSAWGGSGAVVVGVNLDKSGYTAGLISGVNFPASGVSVVVFPSAMSGVFANVPIGTVSGITAVVLPAAVSGVSVTVLPASLSGTTVIVPPATISGASVVIPVASVSGINAVVPVASISGVNAIASVTSGSLYLASGSSFSVSLLSGQQVQVWSGTQVNTFSGGNYLASGMIATEIPKAVHVWNYSGAPNVSGQRCLLNAERKLINAWDLITNSGQLTVFAEDDATVAYTQSVVSVSGASPIVSLNTNE